MYRPCIFRNTSDVSSPAVFSGGGRSLPIIGRRYSPKSKKHTARMMTSQASQATPVRGGDVCRAYEEWSPSRKEMLMGVSSRGHRAIVDSCYYKARPPF